MTSPDDDNTYFKLERFTTIAAVRADMDAANAAIAAVTDTALKSVLLATSASLESSYSATVIGAGTIAAELLEIANDTPDTPGELTLFSQIYQEFREVAEMAAALP